MKKGFVFLETIIVLTIVTLSLTILISSYTLITTKAKERESYDRISEKYLLYTLSNLGTNATYNYQNIARKGYLKITPETCTNDQPNEITSHRIFKIENNKVESIGPDTPCINEHSKTIDEDNESCDFFHIFKPAVIGDSQIMIDSSQYTNIENNTDTCKYILKDVLGLKYLYIIPNIDKTLKSEIATKIFDAGTLNYIKTLKKCNDKDYNTTMDENGNMIVDTKNKACKDESAIKYMVGVFFRNGKYYFASIEL